MKNIFLFLIIFQFISCQNSKLPQNVKTALDLAGENSKELIKVINHYSEKESDSLKLKAAYYLISNSIYHKYIDKTIIYEDAFLKAKKAREFFQKTHKNYSVHDIKDYTNNIFKKGIDSINNLSKTENIIEYIYDLEKINANYLIENIEISFEAYERNPLKLCKNFDDFLHYVLPYRVGNEPLEKGKRKELYDKYSWVFDSLKIKSMEKVIEKIYLDLSIQGVWGNTNNYPYTQSLTQIEQTNFGTCKEASIYLVNLLRSIGIPSGIDFCPRLGTWHQSEGHSWVFYLKGDGGFESINVALDRFEKIQELYRISDIPKIYRRSFNETSLDDQDVTHLYRDSYDINVKVLWNNFTHTIDYNNFYLCVFDFDSGWDKVLEAFSIENDYVKFKNVGNNLIFLPMVEERGIMSAINYPFRLEKNGKITFFNTSKSDKKFDKVTLVRKFMPYLLRDRKVKVSRIRSLNGCVLQGANINSSEEFKDLYTIKNFDTNNNINIQVKACYQFYRLKGPQNQPIHLANFKLLNDENEIIKKFDKVELYKDEKDLVKNVLDTDPLTFIEKTDMLLTYDLGKPTSIRGFQIQARNDDNNIRIGDEYELFYWEKKWKSLGKEQAKDTMLIYHNIPKDALYWLRNLTRGREEFVFTFDDNGKQFWTGISEYKDLDSIMLNWPDFYIEKK